MKYLVYYQFIYTPLKYCYFDNISYTNIYIYISKLIKCSLDLFGLYDLRQKRLTRELGITTESDSRNQHRLSSVQSTKQHLVLCFLFLLTW